MGIKGAAVILKRCNAKGFSRKIESEYFMRQTTPISE